MRILFVSQTFPGALGLLAGAMAATGNEVFFAAELGRKNARIPGVQRVVLRRSEPLIFEKSATPALDAATKEVSAFMHAERSASVALAFLRRPEQQPDIVCCAGDTGITLLLKAMFPRAFFLGYAEWYYNSLLFARLKDGPSGDVPAARLVLRNAYQAACLAECNLTFTATNWQKKQYPQPLAQNIEVFPRCVDTEAYTPLKPGEAVPEILKGAGEVVTITGRGMESTREFLHIVSALKLLLDKRPTCHVTLLAKLPEDAAKHEEFKGMLDSPRVHVMPFVEVEEYRALLRRSDLYLYPNDSNMLSSGIFEALSCGLNIMATNRGAVAEIVRDGKEAYLFNIGDDAASLCERMGKILDTRAELGAMREAARNTVLANFSMKKELPRQLRRISDAYKAWRDQMPRIKKQA